MIIGTFTKTVDVALETDMFEQIRKQINTLKSNQRVVQVILSKCYTKALIIFENVHNGNSI